MAGEIVVFLGPTLCREQASAILNAHYLPPAEQGCVFKAVRSMRPRAVVLIDGAFASVPAVRHKEILWALSRDVPVFGAASMGALRAAELDRFGMRGHGLVYRWYRATPFADDDEVAVAMTPAELGSRPLSDALLNIRVTFRRAQTSGIISDKLRRSLVEIARSIHFLERSYRAVLARARSALPDDRAGTIERLARWLRGNAVDQKQVDAIGLLHWLAGARDLTLTDRPPFRLTEAWADDLLAAGLSLDNLAYPPVDLS